MAKVDSEELRDGTALLAFYMPVSADVNGKFSSNRA